MNKKNKKMPMNNRKRLKSLKHYMASNSHCPIGLHLVNGRRDGAAAPVGANDLFPENHLGGPLRGLEGHLRGVESNLRGFESHLRGVEGSRGGTGKHRSEIVDRRPTIALCGTIGHRPLPGPLPHHDDH